MISHVRKLGTSDNFREGVCLPEVNWKDEVMDRVFIIFRYLTDTGREQEFNRKVAKQ